MKEKEYCEHYDFDCKKEEMTCEGCGYYKKSADEMFEELGYEKLTNCENWIVCGFRSLFNYNRIWFTKEKTIGGKLCDDLTMQELKAINKKVEELGWK